MKRWLILFTVGCLVFATAANAAVEQGDTQIDFLGGYMTQDTEAGDDIDMWFVNAALGYFLTDNIQVGVVGMYEGMDLGGIDTDIYGVGGQGKLHFMTTNQMVPYIGGQILWVQAETDGIDDLLGAGSDIDGDGILYGPLVGMRYELNAYNDFFVEGQYHLWGGDVTDDDGLDDGFGIFVGLIHQFK